MTADEEAEFGGWNAQNKPAIDALYAEMLALEVDLLTSVNTFSLLTCNFQVVAEDVLACLLARGLRSDKETLALRALVAFFGKAAAGELHVAMARMPPKEAATGLVCAAWVSASRSSNARLFRSSNTEVRSLFDVSAPRATRLLHAALHRGHAGAQPEPGRLLRGDVVGPPAGAAERAPLGPRRAAPVDARL